MIEDGSDEEDYEGYFLQPANEYNIRDKVNSANQELLLQSSPHQEPVEHQPRVTFRAELVDFEPEYSSDDGYVDSFDGSDQDNAPAVADLAEEAEEAEETSIDYQTLENVELIECAGLEVAVMCENTENIQEENEKSEEEAEEEEESFVEEEVEDRNVSIDNEIEEISNSLMEIGKTEADGNEEELTGSADNSENISNDNSLEDYEDDFICVPKIECPKGRLSITLCTGHGSERHSQKLCTPVLKLKHRFCCENNQNKTKLPKYNGYNSEYGLSEQQIKIIRERKEKMKIKKTEKLIKLNEQLKNKSKQNEDAFAAWLRNKLQSNNNINKYSKRAGK